MDRDNNIRGSFKMRNLYKAKYVLAAVLSLSLVTHSSLASAQVKDALESHFSSKGSLVSVQGPNSYSTATRNIVGIGSVQVRIPQSGVNPVSVRAPKASAGCGGIDIFSGGFSFINGDQIEELFRNVIQNAKGFAFSLALKIFSTLVSAIGEEFMDTLNKVNGININSCEVATASVGIAVDNISKGITGKCNTFSEELGLSDDRVESNEHCINEDRIEDLFGTDAFNNLFFDDVDPGQSQTDAKREALESTPIKNYAWMATKDVPVFGSSVEMREFLMTLTGTFIVRTDNGRTTTEPIPGEDIDAVMTVLMDGGELDIYKCDEPVHCLRPSKTGKVTIGPDESYTGLVAGLMSSIYDKTSGTNVSGESLELNEEEIRFIDTTPFPVQQAALQFVQAEQAVGKQHLTKYAPIVAAAEVLDFMNSLHESVRGLSTNITQAEQSTYKTWREELSHNIDELGRKRVDEQGKILSYSSILDEIKDARSINAATLLRYAQPSEG